jgi:hypothetical protein
MGEAVQRVVKARKSSADSASVAVQTVQSSLAYALRLSSGRAYLFGFVW